MSRRLIIPLLVAASVTACTTGGTTGSSTLPPDPTSPATTANGSLPDFDALPDECADVPDPARYVEGLVPAIIPPCEVPDELVVHTIREGSGRAALTDDGIGVDYLGMIIGSGLVFDTSYLRDVPLDFPLGRGGVIAGWDQGLAGAMAGSLLRLDIPNDLAYGETPPGDQIQPGDALSFYVEVRAVIPPVTAEDAPLDLQIDPSVGATELTVTDLVIGDGATLGAGDTAIVHLLLVRGDNEVVLFNTWERSDPLQIILEEGQSLPGILQGLEGATVGSLRIITMPPDLAFGQAGETSIGLPGGTDLIVVAESVGVY
ncbi:MAG: FKBP-type peptidyl-prolyl cis-trans isomerase [Ilumatobacteraceae bacterium]